MKLRDEDKKWLVEEIASQLEQRIDSFRPHGWRKLVRHLRELGPIIGSCAFVLALIAVVITLGIFATNRISQESEFRGKTDQRLKSIEQTLSAIENRLGLLQAQVVAQKYVNVPPKELKAHSEELKQVKATMTQVSPSSPGYWPTAFQIIQLASQSAFMDLGTVAALKESTYNNITSRPPGGMGVMRRQRAFLEGHVEGLIFENSIIRFDPNVELVNDVFINCVFLLPIQENPSKPLQEIGKTLLASDLSRVTLNAS